MARLSDTLNALEDAGYLKVVHVAPPLPGARRAELVKALASFNGSRFVSINWRKDDGDERTAVVNVSDFTGVQGDNASPSAQQAVATRRKTNPDLWNAIDHSSKGKARTAHSGRPAWVSIRCRGEITIKQGDQSVTIDLG